MKKEYISIFKSVDFARRKIPLIIQESQEPGPIVWVVAAIHGDEVTGTEIVLRLNRFLNRTPLLKGKVYSLPIMNPTGYEQINRYEPSGSYDLNRCFPGNPKGNTGERIAYKIYSKIVKTKPSLVIDLHTDSMESIPYVYLDQVLDEKDAPMVKTLLDYSELSGINYFVENSETYSEELKDTITGALVNIAKVPSFTLELGGPLVVSNKFVEIGLNSVKNFLSHLDMIQPINPAWQYQYKLNLNPVYETVWNRYTPDYAGIVEYKVRAGDMVKKGDILARIKNLFDNTIQLIKAKEDSLIISYADQSICFPGDELIMTARHSHRAFKFTKIAAPSD
ncbi:succinylglutamate desuccinylase/aspartoacylase family protein [Patescibacteria group bacterium]|nr:succinylglutamate desuccinylase/aspartoacylase family protein [Patescibacteria group bacterium]